MQCIYEMTQIDRQDQRSAPDAGNAANRMQAFALCRHTCRMSVADSAVRKYAPLVIRKRR